MERRVGLPTDGLTRWRCDICSLLNIYTSDECSRCKEPMSKQRKQRNMLLPQKQITSNNSKTIQTTSSNSSSSSTSRTSSTSRRSSISMRNAGKSIISQQQTKLNKNIRNRNKKNHNQKAFGFDNKSKSKRTKIDVSTNNNNNYKMKKLKKENLSEKHLGYKSSKKRNINTFVRSKLNHDTASYRAKFEGKGNPNDKKRKINGMKKGAQYATINDLTKNGFTTSLSSKKKKTTSRFKQMSESTKASITKLNNERPVTPPPKGVKTKGGKRSLIDKLQKFHSGEIMANLRYSGRYMRPQKKRFEGGTTLHEL